MHLVSLGNNTEDVPFIARVILPNEPYGRTNALVNTSGEALVEFYDARYYNSPGQFVSRYCLSTLAERPFEGVNLYGDVPSWFITAKQKEKAVEYASNLMAALPETL